MSLIDVFAHDLLTNSPLFDGDLPTKSILISGLEPHLHEGDDAFQRKSLLKMTTILDFWRAIFDSYNESSIKECERIRWAGTTGSVDLAMMDKTVPIPQQIEKL